MGLFEVSLYVNRRTTVRYKLYTGLNSCKRRESAEGRTASSGATRDCPLWLSGCGCWAVDSRDCRRDRRVRIRWTPAVTLPELRSISSPELSKYTGSVCVDGSDGVGSRSVLSVVSDAGMYGSGEFVSLVAPVRH